jgi:hypothetical protein
MHTPNAVLTPLDQHVARPLMEAEVERARRYGRPLSVLIVERLRDASLAVRASDLAVRLDREHTLIVAPETERGGAREIARRADATAGARIAGMAAFPVDGLSLDALMLAAQAEEATAGDDGGRR